MSALPRLLRGAGRGGLDEHVAVHGALPDLRTLDPEHLVALVERSGLRGHGGAAFPAGRKLRAVASRRGSKVLVATGTEGEPASKKDRTLLRRAPHLVLDGAAVAARAVGAGEAIVVTSEADVRGASSLARAVAERQARGAAGEPAWQLVAAPERFLSGQESALVNLLNGGPGLPTFGPRPFERGVRGRPTLVQNVETLGHIGLIARHGAEWFRELGTAAHPGSALVTVSGAVAAPGVYEIEHGMRLSDLLRLAQVSEPLSAVLVGGFFGTWVDASAIPAASLSGEGLAPLGAALGAGVIVAFPARACPVAETARVAAYLEAESAGQCGPCVNGLGALAHTLSLIAAGAAGRRDFADLERWTEEIPGRGACQHPDGATRFVASALRVFAPAFHAHARSGRCERCAGPPVLPVRVPEAV